MSRSFITRVTQTRWLKNWKNNNCESSYAVRKMTFADTSMQFKRVLKTKAEKKNRSLALNGYVRENCTSKWFSRRERFFDICRQYSGVRGNASVKYKACLKVDKSKVYSTPRASCQIYTFQFLLWNCISQPQVACTWRVIRHSTRM